MRKVRFIYEGNIVAYKELLKLYSLGKSVCTVIPIDVVNEIFSYVKCGKTFKNILHLNKNFYSTYKSKIENYCAVLIDDVLGMLETTTFCYKIMTDHQILTELSEDTLHRHVLEDFGICETNGYEIYSKGGEWYLNMSLRICCDEFEDITDHAATPQNMMLFLPEIVIPSQIQSPCPIFDGTQIAKITLHQIIQQV